MIAAGTLGVLEAGRISEAVWYNEKNGSLIGTRSGQTYKGLCRQLAARFYPRYRYIADDSDSSSSTKIRFPSSMISGHAPSTPDPACDLSGGGGVDRDGAIGGGEAE